MKAKTYEIDSLEKLVTVATDENFERLATDLLSWLHWAIKIKKLGNMNKWAFIWTDDGKEGLTHVKLINQDTGEVKRMKIKKK